LENALDAVATYVWAASATAMEICGIFAPVRKLVWTSYVESEVCHVQGAIPTKSVTYFALYVGSSTWLK
jgi:hypothetical protein